MKKLSTILILSLAFQLCFGQNGCNDSIPNWGESLGVVSFKTNQTWIVGNQEWSDVVMATACQKETFLGTGSGENNNNADCRSNFGYGDLFSWCAVMRFAGELCPNDWRVPTKEDFIVLDKAFGGTGYHRGNDSSYISFINATYLNSSVWGGSLGGQCYWQGGLSSQGEVALYYSQSTNADENFWADEVFILLLISKFTNRNVGFINPQYQERPKRNGYVLRCVRNK
jgi:uncharacterized protein (TIGR02145 family)